jgi:hypothetical protein
MNEFSPNGSSSTVPRTLTSIPLRSEVLGQSPGITT